MAVLAATMLAGPALAPALAEEEEKPAIAGELELGLAGDSTFSSDDPTAEIVDLYPEAFLTVTVNLTQWLGINIGLSFEPVLDPLPSTDRYFGDLGLYVDTLNIQIEHGRVTVVAGKFGPGFGTAWDVTPGVYGTDIAEDYELSEAIGFGGAVAFDAGAAGMVTVGANVFFFDTTILSESAFTNRGRNTLAAGGPGNTEALDNFSITLDGSDIPSLEGFGWHLGFVHLSAGVGDISDVNGIAAGAMHEMELNSGVTLGLTGEIAWFDGANGANDTALYATGGVSLTQGPWHGELATTLRHTDYFAGGSDSDVLAQVSAGYEFENGVDVSAGYAYLNEAGVASHTVGLRLSKTFEFELPRP